jgi:hypothetical protein
MVLKITKLRDILSSHASSDAPYNQQGILMDFFKEEVALFGGKK